MTNALLGTNYKVSDCLIIAIHINRLPVHPLEVVPYYCDPQLQVGKSTNIVLIWDQSFTIPQIEKQFILQ